MVLLNVIVEEFNLADLDVGAVLCVIAFDCCDVGVALVDGGLLGNTSKRLLMAAAIRMDL